MSTARSYQESPTAWLRLRNFLGSRYVREPLIIAIAYFFYYMARHIADDARPAFDNARDLMRIEANAGILKEVSLQSATISYEIVVHVFNIIYFYGHFPMIAAVGVYLFIKNPRVYSITRNAFLISGAVAVVLFALYPVAPPRLAMDGIVDTLALTIPLHYDQSPLVNPYAALPSMHVGWMLLIALGLYQSIKHPLLRYAVLALPPMMLIATVITGNHFFVDGVAGLALAAAAFVAALWLYERWPGIEARIKTAARSALTSRSTTP
ncbi:MAG TPA: phosphatase PAP2 family protein [Dehalococcoidia bacterium]|nr:phosphatase PAP2 family protein [Dehalococcoidia bacterium]